MTDSKFKIVSNYSPQGDQGKAIRQLTEGLKNNLKFQSLLGVTGSGKTYSIANDIEKLRLSTTNSLYTRNDVIVVASVSCIYGLGSPSEYGKQRIILRSGEVFPREEIINKLVNIRYERNEYDFTNGKFRVKGDTIEIFPAYQDRAVRVQLLEDELERIVEFDSVSGEIYDDKEVYIISPATHFLATAEWVGRALETIEEELEERIKYFKEQNKLLEAQRIESRTRYDMEMIAELGFCGGIENYSRHILGKKQREAPNSLLDFFPEDFLVIIDESHIAIPQIRGMYEGD